MAGLKGVLQKDRQAYSCPPPLRSSLFPDGFPGFENLHAIRPRAANRLCSYMRKLIK